MRLIPHLLPGAHLPRPAFQLLLDLIARFRRLLIIKPQLLGRRVVCPFVALLRRAQAGAGGSGFGGGNRGQYRGSAGVGAANILGVRGGGGLGESASAGQGHTRKSTATLHRERGFSSTPAPCYRLNETFILVLAGGECWRESAGERVLEGEKDLSRVKQRYRGVTRGDI